MRTLELHIGLREEGGIAVVDLEGELDTYSCDSLKQKIVSLTEAGISKIVLNMGGVSYIDSAGLGTLVGALKRTRERGGGLKIVRPNSQVEKAFNITGLVRVFDQYADEESALQAFKAEAKE